MASLRERLDAIMPGWDRWYPSAFDAAVDLGLLRARVCAPSSLMLSSRHAGVQQEAEQAFRDKWYVEDEPPVTDAGPVAAERRRPESETSAARRLLAEALATDIPELEFGDDETPQAAAPRRPRRRPRRR